VEGAIKVVVDVAVDAVVAVVVVSAAGAAVFTVKADEAILNENKK